MSKDQDERLAALFEQHNIGADQRGRWMSRLAPEDRALVAEFATWLADVYGLAKSSVQPYTSHVARSLVEPELELDPAQRAALKAFRAFVEDRDGAG